MHCIGLALSSGANTDSVKQEQWKSIRAALLVEACGDWVVPLQSRGVLGFFQQC